jgi:hypothetical protein
VSTVTAVTGGGNVAMAADSSRYDPATAARGTACGPRMFRQSAPWDHGHPVTFLLACTAPPPQQQLLQHFQPPRGHGTLSGYMTSGYIPALRQALSGLPAAGDTLLEGSALVAAAIPGQPPILCEVDPDLHATCPAGQFAAAGAGCQTALAVIAARITWAGGGMSARMAAAAAREALDITARCCLFCTPPFRAAYLLEDR